MLYQPTGPSKEREMIDTGAGSERLGGRRFWRHAGGLGLIGVIVARARRRVHEHRSRSAAARAADGRGGHRCHGAGGGGPGAWPVSVRAVPDRAAAQQAIAERDVYGAVVLSGQRVRELLIASAANNGVANFLRRTLGQPTPEGAPRITDVRPLPEDDATGVDILLLLQVLLIGGSIAVVGIGRLLPRFQGDPRRGVLPVTFLAGYALLFGLALAVISGAFGVGTDASFLERFLAMALISAGVAGSTAALVALIGPAGSAVAGLLYFILGAQISGAGTAPQFLPSFWNDLGQALPGGAG